MVPRRTFLQGACALVAAPTIFSAHAQRAYAKPLKLLVPFAAGGTTDLLARIVADKLSAAIGQPVFVENKAGAGGAIGTGEVARSAPDGQTLCMVTASTVAAGPAINPKVSYDPVKDLTPISNVATTPNVIAVHPSFPAQNFKEFLEEIKRKPGRYTYASAGTGSLAHLQMELFKSLAGVFVTHVPYRGASPALNDTVAGQLDMILDNLPTALPFITAGRLRPIVVASPERAVQIPNTPTLKEVGFEVANRPGFFGIAGPRGLPKDIVQDLSTHLQKILRDPAVKKRIEDAGANVLGNSASAFEEQIKNEFALYKKVVATQRLTPD